MSPAKALQKLKEKFREGSLWGGFLRGLSGAAGVKVASAVLGFLSHVALARVLDIDDYGVYLYVWTWIIVLSQAARLGYDNLLIRFTSEFTAKEKWRSLKGLLYHAHRDVAVASALVAVTGGLLLLLQTGQVSPVERATFAVALMLLPVYSFNHINQSVLRGLKRIGRSNVPDPALRHGILILIFGSMYLGGVQQVEASDAMSYTLLTMVGVSVLGVWWVLKYVPTEIKKVERESEKWFRKALPFLLISGASLIESKTDIITIGLFSSSSQVAIYGVANKVGLAVSFGIIAVNITIAPYISELYSTEQKEKLGTLVQWTTIGLTVYTMLVGAVVVVGGVDILRLFGEEFGKSYVPLLILAAGKAVGAITGPCGHLMMMTGRERIASRLEAYVALTNLGFNLILVPLYGAIGAALATAVSHSIRNVLFSVVIYRETGINSTVLNSQLLNITRVER